jgi:hypothetical protein
MSMRILLKLENVFLVLLGLYVYFGVYQFSLMVLLVTVLLPDVSMIGYLVNTKIGAVIYNLVHNLMTVVFILFVGIALNLNILILTALILFIHIFVDRIFGFGLKYSDNFQHTHLT